MRKVIKEWLSFSLAERSGIVVLTFLILSAVAYRVAIPHLIKPVAQQVDPSLFQSEIAAFEKDTILDLNTATAAQLDRLKGIGPTLSQRIIDYRHDLGGFVALEQVDEVKGIGEVKYAAIVPYLTVGKTKLRKLRINTMTEEQLEAHPYMTLGLARAMIKRREKKGPFENWEEVQALKQMKDGRYHQLRPYMELR